MLPMNRKILHVLTALALRWSLGRIEVDLNPPGKSQPAPFVLPKQEETNSEMRILMIQNCELPKGISFRRAVLTRRLFDP